jgi:hypothetical protein
MAARGVPKDLRDLLDDKFAQHEHRSALAINEFKSEIVNYIHEQEKAAQERHNQTLGVLSAHGSRLDLHELRLNRVEDRASEFVDDRKAATGDMKRWLLTLAASLLMALFGVLLTAAFRWK